MATPVSLRTPAAVIRVIIDTASRRLERAGVETARLDAVVLLAAAAGVERAAVAAGSLATTPAMLARFEQFVARRAAREPVAYIVGRKEFFSLEFEVTPAVLIPRPETETLVSAALEFIAMRATARVLDLGTGSGAIAIAIAVTAPRTTIVATDLSDAALAVGRRNAERHRVAGRIEFRRADLFGVLDLGAKLGRFDLIVSNPPYIDDAALEGLAPEILGYEPRAALAGGRDGLDSYRRIAADAREHLNPGGAAMVEVGAGRAAAVAALFADAGMRAGGMINDLAGVARLVVAHA
jgi:release factor glutamine methyltransferase